MTQNETEKYNQIMTAAAALFAKQGYKKTTIDEIVIMANISKGLFYHYFKNKKEIYMQLYDSYVTILSNRTGEKVDTNNTDFFQRVKQIALIRIDFITEYPNLWNFLYSAYYETHPDVVSLVKEKNMDILQRSYSGSAANVDWSKLRKGLSPEKAVEIVTWIAEGFVQKIANAKCSDSKNYDQFEEYMEYLKTGIYGGE